MYSPLNGGATQNHNVFYAASLQPKLRRIKEPVHDPEPTSELLKQSTPGEFTHGHLFQH